jgi:hypothetical protein
VSEPAKDEAALLEQVVLATCECHPGECYVKMGQMLCCAEDDKVEAVFAAIRAAGWAVVPVEPTMDMICAAVTHKSSDEHSLYFGVYAAMIAAAPGVKP